MNEVEAEYRARYKGALCSIASRLEKYLQEVLEGDPRIDRITSRPKSIDRFLSKANAKLDGKLKYLEPLDQIQDQIGARIITFYRSDVDRIANAALRYFHAIEAKEIVPENEWEFGYFGKHHIILLPADVVDASIDNALVPYCFELQIKTLFQHAWSEANHDLGYKPGQHQLERDELRQLAFTSAQAWGADRIFNELFEKRESLNSDL